jgi:hypothetical protein
VQPDLVGRAHKFFVVARTGDLIHSHGFPKPINLKQTAGIALISNPYRRTDGKDPLGHNADLVLSAGLYSYATLVNTHSGWIIQSSPILPRISFHQNT